MPARISPGTYSTADSTKRRPAQAIWRIDNARVSRSPAVGAQVQIDALVLRSIAAGITLRCFASSAPAGEKCTASKDEDEFLGLVAAELYPRLKAAVRQDAPNHLFLGERFVLRMPPEPVVRAVAKEVDVFCTQALILSPHRPPEWQTFQADGYRRAHELTGDKPMLIIDWPTPFSLDIQYETDRGVVKDERTGTDEAVRFVEGAFAEPYIIGVYICQLAGRHGNDRWFPEGRMKRTYLKDDGTPYAYRTRRMAEANRAVLEKVYRTVSGR